MFRFLFIAIIGMAAAAPQALVASTATETSTDATTAMDTLVSRLSGTAELSEAASDCMDKAIEWKNICTEKVIKKYAPDKSTAVVNKGPGDGKGGGTKAAALYEAMVQDELLEMIDDVEEQMDDDYEDFEEDDDDAEGTIEVLSARQMGKRRKSGTIWGKAKSGAQRDPHARGHVPSTEPQIPEAADPCAIRAHSAMHHTH